ncbi:sigma-70 family RNA polymerase sigma factor [Actinopolymorpha alba]|uniref:sigma-70 family RNA polymerase sigma factor n=1 Tax=Actinopolymorpha alba TaxID=533267 RepID=UPI00035C2A94|nr:sigma-70 family RNA polymerase sigma factor [Actinopolymorpha alba]
MTNHLTTEVTDRDAPEQQSGTLESGELEGRLEEHRVELTSHCYRMLGSGFEAEDAVQEAYLRAWRSFDSFEGRAALRSWLYRIATNVCLDMLNSRQRRARPMDLGPSRTEIQAPIGAPLPETTWIQPMPDGQILSTDGDPAEVAIARETVRLAFVAALQHLPPRQRAVLILREVLRWQASEVADLLGTTVASVNSALQRARATLAASGVTASGSPQVEDESLRELVAAYVDAFERYDLDRLVSLLHDDATMSMPPYPLWLRGPSIIRDWMLGPGHGCHGSRMIPLAANGSPAFAQYRHDGPDGTYTPFAIQVLEISDGRITGINAFLDTEQLFPLFGLPPSLPA